METTIGSVYQDVEGESIVVYKDFNRKIWRAETNSFDMENTNKRFLLHKIHEMGYTKFVGYEEC